VRRRRLALELCRFREAARLTCEEVAEHLECSTSKISRIETGTEDYARAVIAAGAVDGGLEAVERNVAFRMACQPRLTSEEPPQLWAVLDEAALRRRVSGAGLMRLQLDHLLDLSSLPNVAIQVLPFGAGAHPAMGRPFVILAFPERADPDVVYLEDLTSARYVENVDEVGRYNLFFNHLRATALSFEASATLIMSAIKDQLAHRGQPSPLGSGSVCSTVSRDTARVSAT
jgi:hypothetical protein